MRLLHDDLRRFGMTRAARCEETGLLSAGAFDAIAFGEGPFGADFT
jgi:hypothetical protein